MWKGRCRFAAPESWGPIPEEKEEEEERRSRQKKGGRAAAAIAGGCRRTRRSASNLIVEQGRAGSSRGVGRGCDDGEGTAGVGWI